jgi:hypothetical protein
LVAFCALFGKFTSLLFAGLAGIIRQPVSDLDDLIPGIPDALRVSKLVNYHFHASEIAAGRSPYERAKRQFRPGRLSSPAALVVFDRHFRGLVDDGCDVPWLITVSGERKRITALEAIILQLRAKDLSDHPRASKVRLKYEEFARQNSQARPQIVFVDSDYTQALAAKAPKKDDNHDL